MSKKALLVGINNFTRPEWQLNGCVNDTLDVQDLLKRFYGFSDENIKILHDRDATAQGIRDGLGWLLSGYAGGDVRVFHFSSHGTQVDDQGDDKEKDCLDEVIVPYDHDWNKPFRDDDLRAIFATIPKNVNFTFIADCCHSGSIQKGLLDSKVEFKPRYLTPPPEIAYRITELQTKRKADLQAWQAAEVAKMTKLIPPDQLLAKIREFLERQLRRSRQNNFAYVDVERHVLLAACEDRQTAADAHIGGTYRGAFTWGLGQAIRDANGNLTYDALIKAAAAKMQAYEQKPQLECPAALRGVKLFTPLG
jgi:metacaspase-1